MGFWSFLRFVFVPLIVLAMLTPAHAKGFYISAYGGGNFGDVDITAGPLSVKDKTGYAIGAALGTPIDAVPGLNLEADLSYRSNGVDITFPCGGCAIAATDETWALTGNLKYYVGSKEWPVHPYALAGVGYGSRTGSINNLPFPLELTNRGLVWQAGAGLSVPVDDGVALGVEWRVLDAPDIGIGPFSSDGVNHSFMANFTVGFN